jgi:threonine dehydrogenase-like Zn-dependent dehydrogenase
MKILQVIAQHDYAILEVATPEPGPGQILMRVDGVATCPQWDLHLRHNEPMFVGHRFFYPYTSGQPGHEATGFVEAVGPGVTSLKPGDRISAWRDQGHERWGCYAQFVLQDEASVTPVPDGPPAEALASVELAMCIATVFRGLVQMNAIEGRCFGVNGLGPAGLVALQMAKAEGAECIVGFDPIAERRELALSLGAHEVYDPTAAIEDKVPYRGAARLQTSIDCNGAKATVEWLMDHTADVVGLFGVQREDYTYGLAHAGLTVLGYKGHSRESAEYAVALIRGGVLDLAPLITHVLPLERYGEGIDLLEQRKAIKVMYRPWQ